MSQLYGTFCIRVNLGGPSKSLLGSVLAIVT